MKSENRTAYAILGLLSHEPLSGYDLRKRIEATLGLFWNAGFGQIYPALKSLSEGGLVVGTAEKSGGRPEKTVYRLTAKGRRELRQWLEEPAAREYVRYEVLLKLFFGRLVGRERSLATIREFRARYAGQAEALEEYAEELRRVLPESEDHLYYLLTVRFGLQVYRAYLTWADEAAALLKEVSR
jgi:DNA-binding PadR family transcriptional regulator